MKFKVKVTEGWTEQDAKRMREINLRKARSFYESCPFATKVYVSMKTRLTMKFIDDNWEEITKGL